VYILLDAYGSQELNKTSLSRMIRAGIQIKKYAPLRKSFKFQMGLRLHHKIIIIDREWASCGGINLADHYFDLPANKTWLDFALAVQGEIVKDLLQVAARYWKNLPAYQRHQTPKIETETRVKVMENNWFRSRLAISNYYKKNIRQSKKEIIIIAGYFLPGPVLKRALKKAVARGVDVKIILGGSSDIGLMKNAIRFFYPDLLKAGVQLYEWTPSVLHAKVGLFDGEYLTIGSYNLISLSDYGSIECNLAVESKLVTHQCKAIIHQIIEEGCKPIIKEDFEKSQGIFSRWINRMSYYILAIGLKFIFMLQNPVSNDEEDLVELERPNS
ncbi:MAG: phospholipase D-like domain-containing protein, partial [Bacteroidia bacterium]